MWMRAPSSVSSVTRKSSSRTPSPRRSVQSPPPAAPFRAGAGPRNVRSRSVTTAAVDELYAKVVDAGFRSKAAPYDAFWGQRYATPLDPDDNEVHLFAQL